MVQRTALYKQHLQAGGKMVEFAGWQMPIHYGSQIDEHHAVRQSAGMFDVSHMTIVDLTGEETRDFLHYLLANNVDKLTETGKALYTCMLNDKGGIVDDLICYWLEADTFRLVVNAATHDKDLAWIKQQHAESYNVTITERTDLGILAVQGPQAIAKAKGLFDEALYQQIQALKPFRCIVSGTWTIARTGYTGEDGLEMMLPNDDIIHAWEALLAVGVKPCGLGARDTLRLEAGLNLYGTDMDDTTTPYESNLIWTVAMEPQDRKFIGRESLLAQKTKGVPRQLVGLILEDKGVLRGHQPVFVNGKRVGETTSGTFSPTLKHSIALARIATDITGNVEVEIRNKRLPVKVVKPCFVRQGQSAIKPVKSC